MTPDIRSTIRRFYDEVLNQGQLSVIDDLCTPDFVDHTPAQGHSANLDNLKQQITAWRGAFPDLRVAVDELIADGDSLAVRITWEGTHQGEFMGMAATGKRIRSSGVDILHLHKGKVREAWHYGGDSALRELAKSREWQREPESE